jgi:hypothetical protein
VFPAIPTRTDADTASISGIVTRARRRIVDRSARSTRAIARQHFLKRDAVFFDVVAVLRMTCTSIPEMHNSDKAISLH